MKVLCRHVIRPTKTSISILAQEPHYLKEEVDKNSKAGTQREVADGGHRCEEESKTKGSDLNIFKASGVGIFVIVEGRLS